MVTASRHNRNQSQRDNRRYDIIGFLLHHLPLQISNSDVKNLGRFPDIATHICSNERAWISALLELLI